MVLTALVDHAARGHGWAWTTLVRRYRPLVSAICRNLGVLGADAEDVAGTVWLRLVAHVNTLRDPEALPGWLVTTARRECLQLLRDRTRQGTSRTGELPEPDACGGADSRVLVDERVAALRAALAGLSDRDRRLLTLLFADPPIPYTEISARLGMPIGAIGPTRQRCIAKVRRSPAVAALLVNDCHTFQMTGERF